MDVDESSALEALASLTLQDSQAVFESPNQLDGDLITLTLLPRAKWQTLLNLEIIAERNKPKEAPKAPEQAPFFLPTLPGVEHRFAIDAPEAPPSRRLKAGATASAESEFVRRLAAEEVEGDRTLLAERRISDTDYGSCLQTKISSSTRVNFRLPRWTLKFVLVSYVSLFLFGSSKHSQPACAFAVTLKRSRRWSVFCSEYTGS